jgi:hypothetical protein
MSFKLPSPGSRDLTKQSISGAGIGLADNAVYRRLVTWICQIAIGIAVTYSSLTVCLEWWVAKAFAFAGDEEERQARPLNRNGHIQNLSVWKRRGRACCGSNISTAKQRRVDDVDQVVCSLPYGLLRKCFHRDPLCFKYQRNPLLWIRWWGALILAVRRR